MSEKSTKKQSKFLETQREGVAESRISFGILSALSLRLAVKKSDLSEESAEREVLLGLYHRLSACAVRSNHWIGSDLHNERTGDLYEANGNFWNCGSRFCPSCVARLSRRCRREVRSALENQKLFCGENYQFITLTMPNPGESLLRSRYIIDRAWQLFRKRDYFKERIRGGSKSEEFTVTPNGYHYHIHLLCVTRFISYERLRREWTECLKISFAEGSLPFDVLTSDGLAMVNVQRVSGKKNLQNAVLEVCKYVTKSDSWEKIPSSDLIEIASIKRFPRMFELFGCFRDARKEQNESSSSASDNENVTQRPETTSPDTILDTKEISDGKNSCLDEYSGNSPPEEVPKRRRRENWRVFIEKYGLDTYLDRLANEIDRAQEYRRYALKWQYPFAEFRTLDGEVF